MAKKQAVENPAEPPKRKFFHKANAILAFVFYIIWIVVGLFILLSIYANLRQGAYSGIFGSAAPQAVDTAEAPTEVSLPGIGKVKVDCVQSALSAESIQKMVQEGSTNSLTDEEKTKLEPCILEKESPAATPSS